MSTSETPAPKRIKGLLGLCGWKAVDTLPRRNKCILCIAPHTSNWDFIVGQLYYHSLGRKAGFLMKKEWFWGPLGYFFRKLGGIPVHRGRKTSMTETITKQAIAADYFCLGITPEGTRKLTSTWKHGFYYIAQGANIPIQCYAIDFSQKLIIGTLELLPTGDIEADLCKIMEYYKPIKGKHPEKFMIEDIAPHN